MALTIHSYSESQSIIDLYVDCVLHAKRKYGHISIKELCGYTFDDIDNAIKIVIAHLAKDEDDFEFEKQVSNFSVVSQQLEQTFINDDIFQQIDDNPTDKYKNVLLVIQNRILWEGSENLETIKSFSEYCLAVVDNPEYWNIVQNRIGLKEIEQAKKNIIGEPTDKIVDESGYSKFLIYGLSVLFYSAYILAIFYYPIRLAIFIIGIVLNTVPLVVAAKDETLNRMTAYYTFNLVMITLGIIFPAIGIHILIILLLASVFFNFYNRKHKK